MEWNKCAQHKVNFVLSVINQTIIRECRSKAVHECDLFIGVVKNEGEVEVSVKLVIENFHAVEIKLDTYKTRERDPQTQTQPTQY